MIYKLALLLSMTLCNHILHYKADFAFILLMFQNMNTINASNITIIKYGNIFPLLSTGFIATIWIKKFHAKWYIIEDIMLLLVIHIKKL